jgi:hypothetical protein
VLRISTIPSLGIRYGNGPSFPGGQAGVVDGICQRETVPVDAADVSDDGRPGVDRDTHGESHPSVSLELRAQRRDGFDDLKGGAYGPSGIVLVRVRISEVREHAVAKVLRDMPVEASDDRRRGGLVRAQHVTEFLGSTLAESSVEPTRSQNITVSWRRSAS